MEIDLGSQQDGRIIYSDSNLRKCDNTKGEEKAGLLLLLSHLASIQGPSSLLPSLKEAGKGSGSIVIL